MVSNGIVAMVGGQCEPITFTARCEIVASMPR
jgi:hypothetical protein